MKKFVLFIVLLAGLMSCSKAPHFEQVYSFDNKEWKQEQKSSFYVDIDDTSAVYRFVLTIRTTTEHQYNNLWLFWNSETPLKEKVREPFEMKIANPDGSWIGKSSGTVVENQISFAGRKIAVPGKYKFTIEQAVTQPILKDILDIGLTVHKE